MYVSQGLKIKVEFLYSATDGIGYRSLWFLCRVGDSVGLGV